MNRVLRFHLGVLLALFVGSPAHAAVAECKGWGNLARAWANTQFRTDVFLHSRSGVEKKVSTHLALTRSYLKVSNDPSLSLARRQFLLIDHVATAEFLLMTEFRAFPSWVLSPFLRTTDVIRKNIREHRFEEAELGVSELRSCAQRILLDLKTEGDER